MEWFLIAGASFAALVILGMLAEVFGVDSRDGFAG